jgi:hypothetical protein
LSRRTVRELLETETWCAEKATSIARAAINLANHGNIAALRICMDRLLPPRRHEPVTLDVADTIAATSAIVAAVAAGDLTAAEAADLAKVVDGYVQALATAAFEGAPGPAGTKSRALIPRAAVWRPVCKARTLVAFAVWHLPPSACVHRPCPLASKPHTEPRPPKDRLWPQARP